MNEETPLATVLPILEAGNKLLDPANDMDVSVYHWVNYSFKAGGSCTAITEPLIQINGQLKVYITSVIVLAQCLYMMPFR